MVWRVKKPQRKHITSTVRLIIFRCSIHLSVSCCPQLSAPFNGSIQSCSNLPGHTCKFSCDKGYVLVGSATRTCTDNCTWTGAETQCNGKVTETIYSFENLSKEQCNESEHWVVWKKKKHGMQIKPRKHINRDAWKKYTDKHSYIAKQTLRLVWCNAKIRANKILISGLVFTLLFFWLFFVFVWRFFFGLVASIQTFLIMSKWTTDISPPRVQGTVDITLMANINFLIHLWSQCLLQTFFVTLTSNQCY